MTNQELQQHAFEIAESIRGRSEGLFSSNESTDLYMLVLRTVEFHAWLSGEYQPMQNSSSTKYVAESILYAVSAFCSIIGAYGVIVGSRGSLLVDSPRDIASLKDKFVPMYADFLQETHLATQLRLILDMFKLQLIFAALSYDINAE